jgi:hypothetical protein
MNKRIAIAILSVFLVAAFSSAAAHAQTPTETPTPTATWTPRPTRTPTPTSALTRTPFPTPTETSVPWSSQISQANALPTSFPQDWQTVIGSLDRVGVYADTAISGTTTLATAPTPFELDMTDPFSMARGIVIILSDFEWVGLLFGWFTIAFLIIILVEVIRVIVSLWGVVQRILEVIKAIPFV